MQLHSTQQQVNRSKARFKVLNAGRGWGKTHFAVENLLWRAVNGEGKVAYIAPTFQQARDIAWKRLVDRCKDITEKVNESRLELTVKNTAGTESTIVLRGWEAIETLRGQEFDYIVIDEVAMMRNFWDGWEQVLRPTLRISKGPVLFISTPKGFNHWYDLYNTNHTNWESFTFTAYDNPHLHPDEIEEAKAQLPDDSFAQEYLADFRKREGLVYPEFERQRHLFESVEVDTAEYVAGVDFGYTNPAAVLSIRKDRNGIYWVMDELYKTGMTHDEIAEYVRAANYQKVYPDPASPEAIEVMKKKGVNTREVNKGKDSIQTGVARVRELLKQGRIRIQKDCLNLINEFEVYHYPERRPNQNDTEVEVPEKEHDHALDALRYAITMMEGDRRQPTVMDMHRRFHNRRNAQAGRAI